MGNISAHQSISRNVISDSVLIFMKNYADSKFVFYLCIWFKCWFTRQVLSLKRKQTTFPVSLWYTPKLANRWTTKTIPKDQGHHMVEQKPLIFLLLRGVHPWLEGNTPLYKWGITGWESMDYLSNQPNWLKLH